MKNSILLLGSLLLAAQFCYAEKTPEERLRELGIELTEPRQPVANYVNAVRVGNTLYLSGKGPELPKGGIMQGRLGDDLTVEEGKRAARITAINLISVLKYELKALSKIKRIVKLNGMVNSTADFTRHPEVVNGASDILVDVFGKDIGKHARRAVGMNSLPFNIPVEIDLVVEVK